MPRLWWVLRVAAAACFIGHGAFGLLRKEAWLPYFATFGIPSDVAWYLMPLIGAVDVALGIAILVRPAPAVAAYMAVWGLWTALLRPLAGEPVWETLERAGNYGVPLALLLLMTVSGAWRAWIAPAPPRPLTPPRLLLLQRVLAATTALLLVGHGALGLQEKPLLTGHYVALGVPLDAAVRITPLIGYLEIALAAAFLFRPTIALALFAVAWKLATEGLFLVAGAPVWEFIERGGSYAAPLGLALILIAARRRTASPEVARAPLAAASTGAAAALLLLLTIVRPMGAQQQDLTARELLDRLRAGGYVIACRHAATDHDQSDRGPQRAEQRNLSAEGERQARAIGQAIHALRIPVSDVRANPMYRNQETAAYAFGSMTVDSTLAGSEARHAMRALLAAPVASGTNRALVTRTGVLSGTFDGHSDIRFNEGDCAVVRPSAGARYGFELVGKLRPSDWSP